MLEIKQMLTHFLPFLPFVSAAVVTTNDQLNMSALISRMIETAIIGGILMYANIQVIDSKLETMNRDIAIIGSDKDKIIEKVEETRKDINEIKLDVVKIRKDVQHHRTHTGK